MWRFAPLNIDLHLHDPERIIHVAEIPRVLSAHRFSIPKDYLNPPDNRLDRWLQSPALENL
jgi:hypothetical protein